jgi:HlyD family secretion protein
MQRTCLGIAVLMLLFAIASASHSGTATAQPANITADGRVIRAGNVMQIGTAATGVVAELLVHDRTSVAKGQPLIRIECAEIEKELDSRKSNLAALAAALSRVEHGPRSQEIAIATANLALAQARADEADAAMRRLSPDEATVSQAAIDKTKRDRDVAMADLDVARARLSLLQAGSRPEDVSEAKFVHDAAQAQVDEAAARLDRCTVRAPESGIVLSTQVTLGQFVSAAAPQPLLTMVDSDARSVRAEVEEHDAGKLCVGQHAVVTGLSFPGIQANATAASISDTMTQRDRSSRAGVVKDDGEVRTVTLTLTDLKLNLPVGLRVSVTFQPCSPEQSGVTR